MQLHIFRFYSHFSIQSKTRCFFLSVAYFVRTLFEHIKAKLIQICFVLSVPAQERKKTTTITQQQQQNAAAAAAADNYICLVQIENNTKQPINHNNFAQINCSKWLESGERATISRVSPLYVSPLCGVWTRLIVV